MVRRMHVPEAPPEQTEHGLVRKGEGWFVLDARDARWRSCPRAGHSTNLAGDVMFRSRGAAIGGGARADDVRLARGVREVPRA
jgi:hypothetical protein